MRRFYPTAFPIPMEFKIGASLRKPTLPRFIHPQSLKALHRCSFRYSNTKVQSIMRDIVRLADCTQPILFDVSHWEDQLRTCISTTNQCIVLKALQFAILCPCIRATSMRVAQRPSVHAFMAGRPGIGVSYAVCDAVSQMPSSDHVTCDLRRSPSHNLETRHKRSKHLM